MKPHQLRVRPPMMLRRSGSRRGLTWEWGGSHVGCRPTGDSDSNPEPPLIENYSLLVTWKYRGTEFQPYSTFSTFSLHAPLTVEYHSGIAGRSLNRIS